MTFKREGRDPQNFTPARAQEPLCAVGRPRGSRHASQAWRTAVRVILAGGRVFTWMLVSVFAALAIGSLVGLLEVYTKTLLAGVVCLLAYQVWKNAPTR